MSDIFNMIIGGGLIGTSANAIVSLVDWMGKCFNGSCGATPADVTQILTGIGSNLPNVASFIGSGLSKPLAVILNFLPDGGGFPTIFHTATQYFGNMLASVNWLLPVSDLIYCVTFVLSIQILLWTLHIMRVFVSFVRGIPVDRFDGRVTLDSEGTHFMPNPNRWRKGF